MSEQNRLKDEQSPYLLQHADNPVDWYPWSEEAFEKAKKEDKPVLLSIGYSTCHWCHVMAHESFEDEEVARLMNENFVSIKVDREERPDLDNIYMAVCQMISQGNCGWPLNVFMTPEKKPFFAATYIPKNSRRGRAGMMQLIPRLKELWENDRAEILQSADKITNALSQASGGDVARGDELDESVLDLAFEQLESNFDTIHGGFGKSPKFPTPHNILFLLRYWRRSGNETALKMVEKTLGEMRLGGIYDHIGFGFHRYATDAEWFLPHFEKMLYDQAMLATAYIEAYQATGKNVYAKPAHEIFTYVLRDMRAPEGGFYSAEDADSEGEEGKFYVWTEEEIREVLDESEANLFINVFNIESDGNYTEEATRKKTGANIPYLRRPLGDISSAFDISEKELERRIETIREKLFSVRESRIHPHKDDKILTDWNGMMIAALAKGARVLDETEYVDAAKRAARFILENMHDDEDRLLHRYRKGEAGIKANLDDYAFFTWGLLELYETTFDVSYLKSAIDISNFTIKHFWDTEAGGFYFSSDTAEELIVRRKEIYDGATPSGNSVAMLNLLRIGRMTAEPEFEEKAIEIGRAFSKVVKRSPMAHTQLACALDFAVGPSFEVVIAGNPESEDTESLSRALHEQFVPNKVVLFKDTEAEKPNITQIAEYTKDYSSLEGKATVYVCQDYSCELPVTDAQKMLRLLDVGKN